MRRKVIYLAVIAGVLPAGTTFWTLTAQAGYESAEYKVLHATVPIHQRLE